MYVKGEMLEALDRIPEALAAYMTAKQLYEDAETKPPTISRGRHYVSTLGKIGYIKHCMYQFEEAERYFLVALRFDAGPKTPIRNCI
jgi:hypothetical protein